MFTGIGSPKWKVKQSSKLSKSSPCNPVNRVLSRDVRNFWSWGRDDRSKSKQDCHPTVCGKSLPERLGPCNPACDSKCLQLNSCKDKESAKKRLSNCRNETSERTKQKSYLDMLFDWIPKTEKLPDPRSCRVAHQERQILREKDPRLCDSRYESTDGDVFIFTERPARRKICEPSREPPPKPPPSYKSPKSVVTQRFVEQAKKIPHACAAALQFETSCNDVSPKCAIPKASILPFEELRPPDKQRTIFSCKYGVRPEDVAIPLRTNAYPCGTLKQSEPQIQRAVKPSANFKLKGDSIEFSMNIMSTRGKSRVEQLKKMTRAREGSRCCELFARSTSKKVPCCPRSCKMSTLTR